MAFSRSVSLTLDSPAYTNVPATGAKVAFTIEAGEYTPPIWLDVENGPTIEITELPYQVVLTVPP